MSRTDLHSTASSAQDKSHRDPLGDAQGVIEPFGTRSPSRRENIVSARWVARCLTASDIALVRLQEEGDTFADDLKLAGENAMHNAAKALGFPQLWRARKGRVTVGELYDLSILFAAGRGSVAEIVEGMLDGRYAHLPRDAGGCLILEPPKPASKTPAAAIDDVDPF